MGTKTYVNSRLDREYLVAILFVGDLLAVTTFVIIGQVNHGKQPIANPEIVPGVLAPFVLAWLVVAFVGGLYTVDAVISIRRAVSWSLPAWIFAALIAHGLRATSLFGGDTALTFLAVTLVVGGVLVIGWRTLVGFFVQI